MDEELEKREKELKIKAIQKSIDKIVSENT
jgi:hypothetical protein